MAAPDADEFAELALTLHEVSSLEETVDRVLEFAVRRSAAPTPG